jgi:regulator of sigma E protease
MVISVNATNVKTWDEFTTIIKQSPNTTLSMIIIRDGSEMQKSIIPLSAPDIASGRVDQVIGKLGVDKKRKIKNLSFIESFQYGFDQTIWSMILMTTSLKMIFTGNVSRDDIGSVIMIGQMAGIVACMRRYRSRASVKSVSLLLSIASSSPSKTSFPSLVQRY